TLTTLAAITGNGLSNPHAMVFTSWGELLVANANGGSVSRFVVDAQGNPTPNGRITGNGLDKPSGQDGPIGLALAPWGELYVANNRGILSRFTFDVSHGAVPNGTFTTPATYLNWITIVGSVRHTPVADGTSCSDANVCNGDETCRAGLCVGSSGPVIDDGNPCTVDICDPTVGVSHNPRPAGASCADHDPCNGAETCDGLGRCLAGVPPNSDDGNPCTIDKCSPVEGVTHVSAPSGTPCDANSACDGAGQCVPSTRGCATVPAGLVSWWAGDGSAVDRASRNPGMLRVGAAFAPGLVREAFQFSNGGHVEIRDDETLAP